MNEGHLVVADELGYLVHGIQWKHHRYIRKEGNRYIYPEDLQKGNQGKAKTIDRTVHLKDGETLSSNDPRVSGGYFDRSRNSHDRNFGVIYNSNRASSVLSKVKNNSNNTVGKKDFDIKTDTFSNLLGGTSRVASNNADRVGGSDYLTFKVLDSINKADENKFKRTLDYKNHKSDTNAIKETITKVFKSIGNIRLGSLKKQQHQHKKHPFSGKI